MGPLVTWAKFEGGPDQDQVVYMTVGDAMRVAAALGAATAAADGLDVPLDRPKSRY